MKFNAAVVEKWFPPHQTDVAFSPPYLYLCGADIAVYIYKLPQCLLCVDKYIES